MGVDIEKVIADFNRSLGMAPMGYAVGGEVGSDYPVAGAGFPVAGAGFPQAGANFPQAGAGYPVAGAGFPQAGADFPKTWDQQPAPRPMPIPQPAPMGYATGGEKQPVGMIPGLPSAQDNTLTPTATGEYILPASVVQAIGKDKLDFMVTALTGTPPNNAGKPSVSDMPPLGMPQEPGQGFATGGEQQDPLAGQTPYTDSMMTHSMASGALSANATAPVNLSGQTPNTDSFVKQSLTAPPAAAAPVAPAAAPAAPAARIPGLTPTGQPVKHAILTKQTPAAPSAPVSTTLPAAPRLDSPDLTKGYNGADNGVVPGQLGNSKGLVDNIISRQPHGLNPLEVERAIKVNAANGMAPDPAQLKATGATSADAVGLMAANNRHGQFDKQIGIAQQQDVNDIARLKAQNEAALTASEINSHNAQARHWDAVTGNLQTGGGGTPTAYKDFRNGIMGQLDAEGVTDPGERSRRISEAYKQYQIDQAKAKGEAFADTRGMAALDTKTGKVTMVSWNEHKHDPDRYVSTQDPNFAAWKKNVDYERANADFVNSIDRFGKMAGDFMARHKLNQDPKVLNYTVQQVMGMKGMGRGDVAALNALLKGLKGEMSKMAEGSLGVAAASVESAKQYDQIINPSMPMKDLMQVIEFARQEGGQRIAAIRDESNRLKGELGIGAGQQVPGLAPPGLAQPQTPPQQTERVRVAAHRIKSDLGRKFDIKQIIANLQQQGYHDEEINQAYEAAQRG